MQKGKPISIPSAIGSALAALGLTFTRLYRGFNCAVVEPIDEWLFNIVDEKRKKGTL